MGILVPILYLDSILRLQHEALGRVVDDYGFVEGAAQPRQVFHIESLTRHSKLPIKTFRDVLIWCAAREVHQGPVSIVLHAGGEDNYVVVGVHGFEELLRLRPHQQILRLLLKMQQRLIQIQHQRILLAPSHRRQIRRIRYPLITQHRVVVGEGRWSKFFRNDGGKAILRHADRLVNVDF